MTGFDALNVVQPDTAIPKTRLPTQRRSGKNFSSRMAAPVQMVKDWDIGRTSLSLASGSVKGKGMVGQSGRILSAQASRAAPGGAPICSRHPLPRYGPPNRLGLRSVQGDASLRGRAGRGFPYRVGSGASDPFSLSRRSRLSVAVPTLKRSAVAWMLIPGPSDTATRCFRRGALAAPGPRQNPGDGTTEY